MGWEREAIGEVVLPEAIDRSGIDLHPLLLDGCFQVLSAARLAAGGEDAVTYLPFGWERLWLMGPLPERLLCHARLREKAPAADDAPPEVLGGELRFYTPDGDELGGLSGYTLKRATRTALLAAMKGVQDLLYEIVWQDRPLAPGRPAADFLTSPGGVATGSPTFTQYLANEGVDAGEHAALLNDLEGLSRAYALAALERLGWRRAVGESVAPDALSQRLNVQPEHQPCSAACWRCWPQPGC